MGDRPEFRGGGSWPLNRWLNPCVIRLSWYTGVHGGRSTRIEHPFWVLDYSLDAGMRTRVGSRRAPWRDRGARVAHLYPPRTGYWQWRTDLATLGRGGYVVFHLENDAEWRRLFLRHGVYARVHDPAEAIGRRLREGAGAAGRQAGARSFWLAQATLCAVLAELSGARPRGGEDWDLAAPPAGPAPDLAARVEAYFHGRLLEPVTLDDVARALHLSRSSLSHRYRALTGTSPIQTLLALRLERAKSLLVQGYKLDDIAGQCGFYDAAHLSRVFLAKTGQTPRRFARMQ